MTCSSAPTEQQLLHWQQEGSLQLAVTCDQQHRSLWINQQCQSQLQLSEPNKACYPHLQAMLAQLPAELTTVLQFGLGGGEFNRALCHRWPQARLLTVESSAAIIALYQQYFQQPGSQEQFCCQDVWQFLQQQPAADYQLVFVDLYPTPAVLVHGLALLPPLLRAGGQLWLNLTDPALTQVVTTQSEQLQRLWPHQLRLQQFAGFQNRLCCLQAID